ALGPVCDPALKATQVSARVEELAGLLAERLRPLWRSDDRAGELVAARARAATVLRVLVECAGAQMFGALLRALQITAEQVAGVYWRMQTVPDDGNMAPVGTVASTADILRELDGLGLLGDPEPAAAQAERLDYFEHFAGLVVAAWDETLQAVAADTGMLTAFRLPAEQAGLMVGQIAAAAGRTDLRGRLAASLRRHASFHGRTTASAGKFVLIAEDMINDFVTYLGFTQMPEASRPVVGGAGPGRRRIFAAREATVGLPELAPHPAPYDRTFYVDWMAAFARIMEDNVSDQSANPIDPAANEAIGAVIRVLAAGAA
ncbi:MAG TPA: virulence factor SrfC family protein, partial [Rhodopila sp.]